METAINWITGFFTGGDGVVVVIIGIAISWGYRRLKKAIAGTALEGELSELLATIVDAAKDGKITAKEGREIGKAGIDSAKALKAHLSGGAESDGK